MEAFVTGLHIVLCLFLILVVLLQPGKGADFGAMMGGSTGQTGSAVQGATLIGKLTAVVAALFMLTSMSLAWFSNRPQESVISDEAMEEELEEQNAESDEAPAGDEAPDAAPAEGEAAPAEGDAAAPAEGDAAAPAEGDAAAPAEGDAAAPAEDDAAAPAEDDAAAPE
jgi:preprotein translocase subunit SecG